ncbi:hypothetical protein ABS71_06505 [bacterium SCN 62-11]|nr:hypothetical protein [Candidatus Eremiobacteraeota bacterium]ODT73819.1 MAG: hypothetical protein ABS71_06505 [bacterium SCN 62-11]
MHWIEADLLSHPISAVLATLLAGRRGGNWAGPAFLGLLLGWGSLPLILVLTREARPHPSPTGQGFSPSEEAIEEGADWNEWRSYYLNLRQDLIVQVLLALIGLGYLAVLALELLQPALLYSLLQQLGERRMASIVWVASVVWPSVVGWLLISGYWIPWLGRIWRSSDQIWRGSGLSVPAEVAWRCRSAFLSLEESRLSLLEAVRRSRRLHLLTLSLWVLLLVLVAATIGYSVYQLRAGV